MEKFRTGASIPITISEQVAHWKRQIAENPLWTDSDRRIIGETIALVEGKRKADAIRSLQERAESFDGMSSEASFARLFRGELKFGK